MQQQQQQRERANGTARASLVGLGAALALFVDLADDHARHHSSRTDSSTLSVMLPVWSWKVPLPALAIAWK